MKNQIDEALSTPEEAVAVASRSGDRLGVARALGTMGVVHLDRHDFDMATEEFLKARPIAQNIGWYAGLSKTGRQIGLIKMRSGDYREGEALLQDSVSIADKLAHVDEATSALREACLLFQELSRPKESVRVASALMKLKSSQSDWNSTAFWHDHIIAVRRSQKEHREVANHLEWKANILVKAQRYDEAALHIKAAIVISIENGYSWNWELKQLCAIPNTAMKWERRLPLLCDLKKRQRRQPQLRKATLKLPISIGH
ncbi:hypothetical protein M407DRAFT_23102 [Tulasnella calospora MUT 4182]|uniref:MalT-like TPR region domain-containing protein n=1 Tax=Tulasnella calospora MUT 4182 TaxID=1051891 RepID=A0A0C3QLU0_9AGAM|nr:hypothetical protein M407DRAFT_23102 [Tulasnella calospora MUT 4182]